MLFINCSRIFRTWLIVISAFWVGTHSSAQTPNVTVRFANPEYSCITQEYCLDVEFTSDIPDQEVFGVNVRFFYDDELLELIDFRDFQGGYSPVAPDPPIIFTSEPAGPALFNFTGAAEFINGAIQLISTDDPIYLSTDDYTKLFQICFNVDGPIPNLDTFCPPVVWDLEQDPSNGGFLSGDDGVVITIVDPDPNNESYSANENVEQFNWEYTGDGSPPFGQPIEEVCNNINCALPVDLLYFKGESLPESNFLEWKTTSEYDLLGFEVQKSEDKLSWNKIGFLPTEWAESKINTYYFVDPNPAIGNNFYRLLQQEDDGNFHYSSIINISRQTIAFAPEISIRPNPVINGNMVVTISAFPETGMNFRLLNSTGDMVMKGFLEGPSTELNVTGLSSGIYLLMVNTASLDLVKKVTIQQ